MGRGYVGVAEEKEEDCRRTSSYNNTCNPDISTRGKPRWRPCPLCLCPSVAIMSGAVKDRVVRGVETKSRRTSTIGILQVPPLLPFE